ncbi:unnamed protein product [Amoebophrya sp. A120]|nr:unnamed protein product [Amoebophrya sp. A120]|eukprot:GSA120T00003450001.1
MSRIAVLLIAVLTPPAYAQPPPKPGGKAGGASSQNAHVTMWGDYANCTAPPMGFCADYAITDAQVVASLSGFTTHNSGVLNNSTANYYGSWWTTNVGTNQPIAATFCTSGAGASQTAEAKSYTGVTFTTGATDYTLAAQGIAAKDMEDYCSAAGSHNTPPMIGTTSSSYTQVFSKQPSTKSREIITNMVGWAVDGVVIFSPYTGVGTLAPYDETLDTCGGHPANNRYHYHGFSPCLHGESGTLTGGSIPHSKIYGWAFDGFPIYGPYGYTDGNDVSSIIVRIDTGYKCTVSGLACTTDAQRAVASNWACDATTDTNTGRVDECGGRWTKTPEFPNGMYVYVLNVDTNGKPGFPGVPYCKHMKATGVMQSAAGVTAASSDAFATEKMASLVLSFFFGTVLLLQLL